MVTYDTRQTETHELITINFILETQHSAKFSTV